MNGLSYKYAQRLRGVPVSPATAAVACGGTGVAPVKSGVAPDFVRRHSLLVFRYRQRLVTSRYGFGRDALNNRPEACATQVILPAVSPSAGFSLIEVMVAILILGIALAGLTTGITTALGSSKESELQATAALLAAGQVETLRTEGGLVDGEKTGDFGAALTLYRWQQTIRGAGVDGLHEVAVAVNSAQDGRTIYELKTMLFEPVADSTTTSKNSKTKKKRSADQ